MYHTNIVSMHFWITFTHMHTIVFIKWTTSSIFHFIDWVCTRHFIWRSFLPYLLLWLFIFCQNGDFVFILKLSCLSFRVHEDKETFFNLFFCHSNLKKFAHLYLITFTHCGRSSIYQLSSVCVKLVIFCMNYSSPNLYGFSLDYRMKWITNKIQDNHIHS